MTEAFSKYLVQYKFELITANISDISIILAVAHKEFLKLNFEAQKQEGAVIYDVKGIPDKNLTDGRL